MITGFPPGGAPQTVTQGSGAHTEQGSPAGLRRQRLESRTKERAGGRDIRNAQRRFQKSA